MREEYSTTVGARYRDVDDILGLRIVVDSMNTANSTFDLIELSPRLLVDVTSMTLSYSSGQYRLCLIPRFQLDILLLAQETLALWILKAYSTIQTASLMV